MDSSRYDNALSLIVYSYNGSSAQRERESVCASLFIIFYSFGGRGEDTVAAAGRTSSTTTSPLLVRGISESLR